MPFVIHANLDAEARWAGITLPAPIATRASYYAALTAALAPDGAQDIEVWTPAPIELARIAFPVTLKAGAPPRADLVWADRKAADANDRRFSRWIGAETGVGVPGARVIEHVDALTLSGPWVAKAPFTTAGRDRCHGEGVPTGETRTRLSRLLERFKALVVEPWLPRIADVGVCASTSGGLTVVEAPHGLVTDARGTFLGIDLAPPALTTPEREALLYYTADATAKLLAMGYQGPLAIDAFVAGPERRLCVCEINARYTFAWVARALSRRHGTGRLGFSSPPPPGAKVLIKPANDGITAWIA